MAKDRSIEESITVSGVVTRRNIDGGDPPGGYQIPTSRTVVIEQWRDGSAKNPNWREDIKAGRCATTTLKGHREFLTRSPASFDVSSTHGDYVRGTAVDQQAVSHADDPSSVDVSFVDSLARTKLVRKANERQRPFQGGVFLGELRETLRMIRNPAAALSSSIKKHVEFMRRKTSRLKRGSEAYRKAASGSWLEAVFGWLPFISDIDSGMKALRDFERNSRRRIMVTANSSDTRTFTNRENGDRWYANGDIRTRYWAQTQHQIEVRYRAMLQWDASAYRKFKYVGLSFGDILPTAWELVPGSFLADYFVNIGEIVEGYSFCSSRLRWVDRGSRVVTERSWRMESWRPNLSPNGPGVGWFQPETLSARRVYVERDEIKNFNSVPDLTFSLPGVRQMVNMAALWSNKTNHF